MKVSYTITETYALLPDNIEDAVGCILRLHHNATETSIKNFGYDTYIFVLAKKQNYHRNDNDRIRLIPIEQLENPQTTHLLATILGYEEIKKKFVVYGIADVSHINL